MDLISHNQRHTEYNNILLKLPIIDQKITLQTSGKLIFCLIEFRLMLEIQYVIHALFSSYQPHEIGISIVYGTKNATYVEETFKNFENIKLIKYEVANLDRGTYSALLKTPEFYENFTDWSHILIYQTDALLFRKVDDIYFEYDYIGAPWISSNQWCKYNAGNGGFSLRKITSCINACNQNRHKNFLKDVHRGNEDGFFCSQDNFKYPPINTVLHKAFSVERVHHPTPIGCHQIYHNFSMTTSIWKDFLVYMTDTLINKIKPTIDIQTFIKNSPYNNPITLTPDVTVPSDTKIIDEILDKKFDIYQFSLKLTHKDKNRWVISSNNNYEILFCKSPDPNTYIKSYNVNYYIESIIHKKASGVYHKEDNDYAYLIFYPGFPNGGESWADITACGHYNHCRELPKNGAIILKASKTKVTIPNNNDILETYNLNKQHNVLVYDLFTGVGFYNQLFSLETAIYLAAITKRYLIINIQHPLVACGKPDRNYGTIFNYISTEFENYIVGYEIRCYSNLFQPHHFELSLPNKFSSLVFVDEELENSPKLTEFANGRQILKFKQYATLFDINNKLVYIKNSNASRVFYNFFTTSNNYSLMSKISNSLAKFNTDIITCFNTLSYPDHFYGIHLRLGDWHKPINNHENKQSIHNIKKWLNKNNTTNSPICIMCDKTNPILSEELKQFNVIYTESIINNETKLQLQKLYKNTTVAEFILQKLIIDNATTFIGSQGSTVSVHCQYMHFLQNKPHNLYTQSSNISYNSSELKYTNSKPTKNFTWNQINYMGGHPISWSMFFPDNIQTISNKQITPSPLTLLPPSKKSLIFHNFSHSLFIGVDTWYDICDYFVTKENDTSPIIDILETIDTPIIGVKTDLLPKYVCLLSNISKPFILITVSNDDHCTPYMNYPRTNTISSGEFLDANKLLENGSLIAWFSKNPAIIHSKILPLPLGPKWQWKTTRFHGEDKSEHNKIFQQHCLNPKTNFLDTKLKKNLLYFNFAQTTNNPFFSEHKNIRHTIKTALLKYFKWNDTVPFSEYIETLKTYKFCLAPPGRGIDTHRCWEALMVGTIPIVQSSSLNNNYINLPVLIVHDWSQITPEFLEKEYTKFNHNIKSYMFEKLYTPYWYSKLLSLKL